jgi:glutathione S-transferase
MMTLYYTPGTCALASHIDTPGTCALASHIALEQADARYQARRVDFSKNEQRSPEYLRVNPKGRVPALVTERGVLTETPAILMFISQSFPDAKLMPLDDPFATAQAQSFNSYLCSTVHVAHAHKLRGHRWADDPAAIAAMQKKVPQSMSDCFEMIENEMIQGPWVLGSAYSVCDMYLFTVARWLESDGVDPARFPKVFEHRQRMADDPVVRRVLAAELAGN